MSSITPDAAPSDPPSLRVEQRGAAGFLILDRPAALNALTHGMVRSMAAALDAWEHDASIARVVICASGGRAFCAGGDIRNLHDLARAGRTDEMRAFWREEYALNLRIRHYPKPYIAVIDGVVMGGGVGISLHGSHRVAGERYSFAMPEVGIGFFPDVGATYVLPRLPHRLGHYLALTGARVRRSDALALGLATHAIASSEVDTLLSALTGAGQTDAILAAHALPTHDTGEAPGQLLERAALIDRAFSGDTMEDISATLERVAAGLDEPDASFARETRAVLAAKSPTSLKLALAQMQIGSKLSFMEAMRLEFRIVSRLIAGSDFIEGVRALIVDKDNAPAWSPATLAEVSDSAIAAHFEPLPDDLEIPEDPEIAVPRHGETS